MPTVSPPATSRRRWPSAVFLVVPALRLLRFMPALRGVDGGVGGLGTALWWSASVALSACFTEARAERATVEEDGAP